MTWTTWVIVVWPTSDGGIAWVQCFPCSSLLSTITLCFVLSGVIGMFEEYYKAINPMMVELEYDLATVLCFVDAVHDMSCLM